MRSVFWTGWFFITIKNLEMKNHTPNLLSEAIPFALKVLEGFCSNDGLSNKNVKEVLSYCNHLKLQARVSNGFKGSLRKLLLTKVEAVERKLKSKRNNTQLVKSMQVITWSDYESL